MRYYLAVRDSDMFACGERGGKHKLFSSLRSRDMLGFAERDIFALQMRYYLASEIAIYSPLANVVESTLHINPHAAQFAAYRLPQGKYRKLGLYRKSVRIYIALVCLLRQTN